MDGSHSDERLAAAAANSGREVPAELLRACPARTLRCSGVEFKHYRSLALTSRARSVCCVPIGTPLSAAYAAWAIFTNLVDMTYTAFLVALSVGFNHSLQPRAHNWLSVCDWVGSLSYIADMAAGFNTGFIATWGNRAVVVRDARASAWFYVRHGSFIIDFIAIIPFLIQLCVLFTGYDSHLLRMVFALRLLRLLRVVRLLSELSPGAADGPMRPLIAMLSPRAVLLIQTGFSLAVLVNLFACLFWNVALDEGLEHSWAGYIENKDFDLLTASDATRWVISCYFALTTLVTIGYGDITPVTVREVGLVIVFEIVGVAFFGFLLNQVAAVLAAAGRKARRAQAVKNKLQQVEERMQGLGLSAALKRRIRGYYMNHWLPVEDSQAWYELYEELPPQLRVKFIQQHQEACLRQLSFFPPNLPPRQLRAASHALAAASVPVMLVPGQQLKDAELVSRARGEDVASEEASGASLYILAEGEMRMLRTGERASVTRRGSSRRVDFCGPAVVGLAGLFNGLSSSARQEPAVDSRSADTGMPNGIHGAEQGAADGNDGIAPCQTAAAPAPHQQALALTDCHLWRVSCRQLSDSLREHQPAVLLHLVTRLLARLGARGAAGSSKAADVTGTGVDEGVPAEQLREVTFVQHLRALQAELEIAVAAAEVQQQSSRHRPGIDKMSLATTEQTAITDASWRQSVQLSTVEIGGARSDGSEVAADVWHAD